MTKFVCETLGTSLLLSVYIFKVYFDFIEFRNSIILKKKKKKKREDRKGNKTIRGYTGFLNTITYDIRKFTTNWIFCQI